jgi:hypothetical protein
LPFCPSVLWAQLIAGYGSWRYIGLLCGVWSFLGFVLTAVFYWPPPRRLSVGLSRREVLRRIDFIGGFLSIAGLLLFMSGIQWGGYQYTWTSAHVLAPLLIGALLFVVFCVYEWKFAKFPMFPSSIAKEPRLLLLTLLITFISGMQFFGMITMNERKPLIRLTFLQLFYFSGPLSLTILMDMILSKSEFAILLSDFPSLLEPVSFSYFSPIPKAESGN